MLQKLKPMRGVMVLFVILTALFITQNNLLVKWGVNCDMLIIGNMVIFLITLLSFLILSGSLQTESPHAFVRAIYTSFIVKFFAIAIAAFIYIILAKDKVNKPALFGCMALYLVYTFTEVSVLLRMLKQKRNA